MLALGLVATRKQKEIFRCIAIFMPIVAITFTYIMPQQIAFDLFKTEIIYDGSFYNKLIGFAFCIVLLAANLYSIGQNKKFELILGNFYAASMLLCLFAGDFLSLFIGLELMMLFSSSIIFIGEKRFSIRSAKKYFITHLTSSSLILFGIVHIISKSKSLALVNVTSLMSNPEYSTIVLVIMLIGMLINIAAFPFSGWMVNYYQNASTSGFIYLISFTTKLSIFLILKLFSGLFALKYIGVLMIIYASIKAILENSILRLLCYLSIMAMGLMLMGISIGTEAAISSVIYYLFIHILYKATLSICSASVIDTTGIIDCSDLKKISNNIITIGAFSGIAMMISLPGTSALQIKSAISHLFSGDFFYLALILLSLVTVYSLPWKNCLKKHVTYQKLVLNNYSQVSLIFISFVLTCIGLFGDKLLFLTTGTTIDYAGIFSFDSLKQLVIISLGFYLALKYKIKKLHTKSINLVDWFGKRFLQLHSWWFSKNNESTQDTESLSIESLEYQISTKLATLHNQKTAIFIVFIVFLTILITLLFLA
jgi:multicomponent Na+:H+ antiporter subunit D